MIRLGLLILMVAMPGPVIAGACNVPGTHPTIQQAIDDLACNDIELSSQSFTENISIDRSLSLSGPGEGVAILRGQAVVTGLATSVSLTGFRVDNGCSNSGIAVSQGAQVSTTGMRFLVSEQLPCIPGLLLYDGFES